MSDFGRGYFSLHPESVGELRSYSASSRNGINLLKLEVSFSSASEMGYAIEELAKLQASIKAVKTAARRRKPSVLALPAPEVQP